MEALQTSALPPKQTACSQGRTCFGQSSFRFIKDTKQRQSSLGTQDQQIQKETNISSWAATFQPAFPQSYYKERSHKGLTECSSAEEFINYDSMPVQKAL